MTLVETGSQKRNYYEIAVDFDDEVASVGDSKTYFSVLDKYDALGIGHDRSGTSTMLISSEQSLNIDELAEDLEDIKILEVFES